MRHSALGPCACAETILEIILPLDDQQFDVPLCNHRTRNLVLFTKQNFLTSVIRSMLRELDEVKRRWTGTSVIV